MKDPAAPKSSIVTVTLYALTVSVSLFHACLATIAVLAIVDVITTANTPVTTGARSMAGLFGRVNWAIAAAVFISVFLLSQIYFHRKGRRKLSRGTRETYSIISSGASPDSLTASPAESEPEASFKVRRMRNRYDDLLIGIASVRFNVSVRDQEFRIEQRARASDLDLLPVTPVNPGNSTANLIGKYHTSCSDRQLFDSFMMDDEVIGDLLVNYNARQKTTISLLAGEFSMECVEEDIFENGSGIGHEESLLKILQARSRIYHRRFASMGLLAEGKDHGAVN